jgi:pimeloyl-ACP methyl ester carboxylesterase
MEAGRLSGIEAFAKHKLAVRGSIHKSLEFETLFERPDDGALRFAVRDIRVKKMKISTLIAGPRDAQPLVLLHGLGASKASWLPIVPQLAEHYRVMVVDLPGFGASSKPRGRYDAKWFATQMFGFLDAAGYESAFIAGNSMGGRIAQEMAMMSPDRVDAIACLCPATAFSHRPVLWATRLLRPELGSAVAVMPRNQVVATLRSLFAKPSRVHSSWYEAAVDEFMLTWRSPRARMAFFAAARHLYLEEPNGEQGFWSRLSLMCTPAFYIYGRRDTIITHHFGKKVGRFLPSASVEIWDDCGHVPQIEHSERTVEKLLEFFDEASGSLAAEVAR